MNSAAFDTSITSDVVLVCISDGDVRETVTTALGDRWPVRTVRGGTAIEAIDDDVAVVVLDLDEESADIESLSRRRDERDLSFEIAALVDVSLHRLSEKRADGYVTKPVSGTELRTAIDRLQRRARYDRLLQRYYSLSDRYASLAAQPPEDPEELERVRERLVALRARLDEVADGLDDEDAFDVALDDYEEELSLGEFALDE